VGLEAFSQILDIIAFILVTPEFLSGERLQTFRRYLSSIVSTLSVWLDESPNMTTSSALFSFTGLMFVLVVTVVATQAVFDPSFSSTRIGHIIDQHIGINPIIIGTLLAVICIGLLIFTFLSLVLLILTIVQSVLVRVIAFSIGTGLFLLSRCIMIWLTWHPHP
jgi:hypothetical protein